MGSMRQGFRMEMMTYNYAHLEADGIDPLEWAERMWLAKMSEDYFSILHYGLPGKRLPDIDPGIMLGVKTRSVGELFS